MCLVDCHVLFSVCIPSIWFISVLRILLMFYYQFSYIRKCVRVNIIFLASPHHFLSSLTLIYNVRMLDIVWYIAGIQHFSICRMLSFNYAFIFILEGSSERPFDRTSLLNHVSLCVCYHNKLTLWKSMHIRTRLAVFLLQLYPWINKTFTRGYNWFAFK